MGRASIRPVDWVSGLLHNTCKNNTEYRVSVYPLSYTAARYRSPQNPSYARSKYPTQLAKISFD